MHMKEEKRKSGEGEERGRKRKGRRKTEEKGKGEKMGEEETGGGREKGGVREKTIKPQLGRECDSGGRFFKDGPSAPWFMVDSCPQ